jgi:hypothetical protein
MRAAHKFILDGECLSDYFVGECEFKVSNLWHHFAVVLLSSDYCEHVASDSADRL